MAKRKKKKNTNSYFLIHNAIEALGAIRSRLPCPYYAKTQDFRTCPKAVLVMMLVSLEIADQGMDLEPEEQTGSSGIYRVDLSPLRAPKDAP